MRSVTVARGASGVICKGHGTTRGPLSHAVERACKAGQSGTAVVSDVSPVASV